MTLSEELRREALGAYARLGGGWPVPLAGGIWWLTLAYAATRLSPQDWALVAFVTSGTIFPMALLIARLAGNDFIRDRTALSSLLLPAFVGMLLFWPGAIVAYFHAPDLVPLILAIGMSGHWPVIGWSYGRAGLFIGHCLVRAVAVTTLWLTVPDDRWLSISLAVATIYAVTVAILLVDSRAVRRQLAAR